MRAALVTLAAVLVLAVPAGAAPFGPAEEAAWAEAEAYWGVAPALCTTITKEVVPPGSLGVDVQGRATQPTYPQPCGVWIVEGLGEALCGTVAHEFGHLLGHGHEDPELANMRACGLVVLPDVEVERRQAWEFWRESRSECREARGPYRPKCWRALRASRQHILLRFGA